MLIDSTSIEGRLALAKLAESGLDADDALILGLEVLTAAEVEAIMGVAMPAIRFEYRTLDGQVRTDLYRLRVLGPLPTVVGGFGQKRDVPRYYQNQGSPVGVYYPQNAPGTWAEIAADHTVPLVITEGEFKAAAATKAGFVTLALGGVWSWCNRKAGSNFLTDLGAFVWGRREVTIAFDSDATQNHHIAMASAALIVELRDRGAVVTVADLPEMTPGKKCGLDDLIVARGADALRDVLNDAAMADDLTTGLYHFNTNFVYLRDPGKLVYDLRNERIVSSEIFLEGEGNVRALKVEAGPRGQRRTRVKVAREWMDWPARRSYDGVTYTPGQPRIMNGVPGRYRINTWRGLAVEPLAGDVGPWDALLDLLFRDAEPSDREWFVRWCACPLQRLGIKMANAAGIWSREQGQGKSLIGVTLGAIYGPHNYISIDERQFESEFNFWANGRQLVMVDDLTSHESRANADRFKKLITQQEIVINLKFTPQYVLPDTVNYYMTSNRPDAFYIEKEDRRFFVHEVTARRAPQRFYDEYHAWLRGGGPRALLAHLLALPMGDFNPYVAPPLTRAKQAMIVAARSDAETWVAELAEAPETKLKLGDAPLARDLWTTRELMALYLEEKHGNEPGINVLAKVLGAHFKMVRGGGQVKINGRPERLWAVRNADRWLAATTEEIAAHVEAERKREGVGGASKF